MRTKPRTPSEIQKTIPMVVYFLAIVIFLTITLN